jgi:crotonobetainyl-CoA:carnitine CoA-transferase CaiB-like acyl-CoA transferase
MQRPFEGIKVLDITHVLAGPFAAYQLAVLGADVLKIENPDDVDQSRYMGSDKNLNAELMGTNFLTQNSNKKSITLNLKTEKAREVLKQLVKDYDVFIENYRAGSFRELGLGYDDLKIINPKLIYCSMTGYGQNGPRAHHTVYDHLIQANSGIMSSTGTPETAPIKTGIQFMDYATGTVGAFAISSALFQRSQTGKGQYIDVAMLDVAAILSASHITGHSVTGHAPKANGNGHRYASSQLYETKDGLLMLGAANPGQHRRLMNALDLEQFAHESYAQREAQREEETAAIANKLKEKTAEEWETYLQKNHVPAAILRTMPDMLKDPHLETRGLLHRYDHIDSIGQGATVPIAAFTYQDGGPRVDTPPPTLGADTDQILKGLGYSAANITALREDGAI